MVNPVRVVARWIIQLEGYQAESFLIIMAVVSLILLLVGRYYLKTLSSQRNLIINMKLAAHMMLFSALIGYFLLL